MDPSTIDKTAHAIIQDKSKPKTHPKISTLPLHNAATLETWRRRFNFISKKIIKQLSSIITDIKITDLENIPKPKKGEP